jgi:diguanylate cyclase (GGDEF)-like protein
LFLALVGATLVVGALANALISSQLEADLIEDFASTQRADARGFEELAKDADRVTTIREIDKLLEALGRRPGATEASLIDSGGVIVASSEDALIGSRDRAPQIRAALDSGLAYSGREADPGEDATDFEFLTALDLPGRHVLESSFDSGILDRELADIRRVVVVISAFALFAVTGFFYLFGGRSLLRSHRIALQRATRDGLTDLPNQRAFQTDLEQAAALAGRYDTCMSLAVLDVDHFKLINDRHGHPAGDALLIRIAALLRDGRSGDRAYRIGGDEFALLLPSTDCEGARTAARRLSRRFADADAAVSVGVATLRSGESPQLLRGEADAALYEAKRSGGRQAVHFDDVRGKVTVASSSKREAVARLIEEGAISTVFQPIWDFGAGELIGVEALSRPDEAYGFSGPAEVFELAAEIGVVHELDVLCATRSLIAVSKTRASAEALLFLNIAPETLERDAGEGDWLIEAVVAADLSPDRVVVEITERVGSRVVPVVKSLNRLREQGFKLALDDVGTGNSGLEMLRKVDADYVKIDRSIVAAAPTESNARAVLMAMATFAAHTGAFVIAEGVEDEETLEFLRGIEELDVQTRQIIQGGQGYELGRPEPSVPTAAPQALADRSRARQLSGAPGRA